MIFRRLLIYILQKTTMKNKIFVDTSFVVALISKNDQYHEQALVLSKKYEKYPLISTDVVLFEIGNALARNCVPGFTQDLPIMAI